jgi:putative tryptophan/tyrosine transport system substrate-binding protein
MKRREFISLGSSAAAWPRHVLAQRALPFIGILGSASPGGYGPFVDAFRQGISAAGYVEGQNVVIDYRWAEGRYDRVPSLAADLVRRPIAVIVTMGGTPPSLAAIGATATIP